MPKPEINNAQADKHNQTRADKYNQTRAEVTNILLCSIPHTICWWFFESYTNDIYAFNMLSVVVFAIVYSLEYLVPGRVKTMKALIGGLYAPVFVLMIPKFSFLAICTNFVCFWSSAYATDKIKELYWLILANFFGWAGCYVYYLYLIPVDGYQDASYIKMFFDDSLYFYQFLLSVAICYCLTSTIISQKNSQFKARELNEQELIKLNKSLEEANQKLYRTNKELQEALQEKENFILRFSHEIRNPLNSLLGNVDLCQEYAEDEQARQMLNDAKVSGEILLQLLNNILDTAKVSAGRLDLSLHYQNIRDFLERAWVVCSEIIRKKKLYGSLFVNENVPKKIEFDSHRLMQILINMISNASKFTEYGYVKVFIDFEEGSEIRAEDMKPRHADSYEKMEDGPTLVDEMNEFEFSEYPLEKYEALYSRKKRFEKIRQFSKTLGAQSQGKPDIISKETFRDLKDNRNKQENGINQGPKVGYLRLEIVDTGCGIKKKDLETLFTKFNQVNEHASKRQIGTGLGLWITKEIVELMEGKIEVFSVPDHGTVLVMMLKCKSAEIPSSLIVQSQSISDTTSAVSIKRVMVVEDIPYNQEINVKFLQKCDVQEVEVANNGQEALDLYLAKGEGYFDLILMDIDMPIMDGKTATKKIRQHEEENEWKSTILVFLTAYSEAKMQQELLDPQGRYKADGFLSKPTSQEILRRTLTDQSIKLQEKRRRRSRQGFSLHPRKQHLDFISELNSLVLLIDDDPYNLSIVSKMISKCGLRPLEASNAKQALDLYEKYGKDIKLVLTDCEMPIMDGLGVTREILEGHKKSQRVQKVVIYGITGYVDPEYKKKCFAAGMKDVVEKPITFDGLRSLLLNKN